MKTSYTFLLVASLITGMVACKKDKDNDNPDGVKGSWELAAYETSWIPLKTYDPGNGNTLEIKNGSYAYYKDGQVQEQGNYSTVVDTVSSESICKANTGKYINRIDFSNITPTRTVLFMTFFYIENDMLYMNSGCRANDSYVRAVYRRKTSGFNPN
jgi:hypothetical protein